MMSQKTSHLSRNFVVGMAILAVGLIALVLVTQGNGGGSNAYVPGLSTPTVQSVAIHQSTPKPRNSVGKSTILFRMHTHNLRRAPPTIRFYDDESAFFTVPKGQPWGIGWAYTCPSHEGSEIDVFLAAYGEVTHHRPFLADAPPGTSVRHRGFTTQIGVGKSREIDLVSHNFCTYNLVAVKGRKRVVPSFPAPPPAAMLTPIPTTRLTAIQSAKVGSILYAAVAHYRSVLREAKLALQAGGTSFYDFQSSHDPYSDKTSTHTETQIGPYYTNSSPVETGALVAVYVDISAADGDYAGWTLQASAWQTGSISTDDLAQYEAPILDDFKSANRDIAKLLKVSK
jgi:hypothetical protein